MPPHTPESSGRFDAASKHGSFDRFLQRSGPLLDDLQSRMTDDSVSVAVAEARHALQTISPHLHGRHRVLEVGAGLGVLAGFVASLGHDVTALEPGGIGFEQRQALTENPHGPGSWWPDLDFRNCKVEDLDPEQEKPFGLIYSVNVLEPVDQPDRALAAMAAVLSPDGIMVHECPNYHVPFEPHFGVPLLPFRPVLSASLLPSRITDTGLWRSLNFLTSSQVGRIAADLDMRAHFEPGLLAQSLERLDSDAEFRDRHRGIAAAAGTLRRLGLINLLARLPASASTPMVFTLEPGGSRQW
jgi:SAM-dependent methyltransferase